MASSDSGAGATELKDKVEDQLCKDVNHREDSTKGCHFKSHRNRQQMWHGSLSGQPAKAPENAQLVLRKGDLSLQWTTDRRLCGPRANNVVQSPLFKAFLLEV